MNTKLELIGITDGNYYCPNILVHIIIKESYNEITNQLLLD